MSGDKISFLGGDEAARLELARTRVEDSEGLHRALVSALRLSAEHLRTERVAMWMLEAERLRCVAILERGKEASSPPIDKATCSKFLVALHKRRAIVADDAATHRYTAELSASYLTPNRVGALIAVPVYRAGKLVGCVTHERTGGPHAWTESDASFASTVGDVVSTLLEQADTLLLQDRLRKAEAEALLARVAREVAHDFAQYLQVIGLWSAHAPQSLDEAKEGFATIHDANRRATALVRSLLALGRSLDLERVPANLGKMLREISSVLGSLVDGARHSLAFEGTIDVTVKVDPSIFERMLVNLVTNARDAMPNGGRITISVTTGIPFGSSRRHAAVIVADQGPGIPDAIRDRLFEPYFTTKSKTTGSGLGLAFVAGAIQQHGGCVEVRSGERGTQMVLWFPEMD